jgi:hypothetical protein
MDIDHILWINFIWFFSVHKAFSGAEVSNLREGMSNGKFTADLEKSAVIAAKNTFVVSTDTNHPWGFPWLKGAANILDGGGAWIYFSLCEWEWDLSPISFANNLINYLIKSLVDRRVCCQIVWWTHSKSSWRAIWNWSSRQSKYTLTPCNSYFSNGHILKSMNINLQ